MQESIAQMFARSATERAIILANQGRTTEAVRMLLDAAENNDAQALTQLAIWRLSGQFMPRDLPLSRDYFGRAASLGHSDAARVYNAFVANGTGGAADWPAALAILRERSLEDPAAAEQLDLIGHMDLTPSGNPAKPLVPRHLSMSPHIELFPKALSHSECDFLIRMATPLAQPAVIVDPHTGRQVVNPIRTSDAAAFPFAQENPAIHAINRRVACISGIPAQHGEPLQVLRYRPGQEFRRHSDALPGVRNQRIATVLIYLNDAFTGGETQFPVADMSIRGEIGDALLFRNVTADGRIDQTAIHAGLPVRTGIKYVASRWIRMHPLDLSSPSL